MVTENMLQNAAVEAEQAFLSALADLDVPPHEFSKPFEKLPDKIVSLERVGMGVSSLFSRFNASSSLGASTPI